MLAEVGETETETGGGGGGGGALVPEPQPDTIVAVKSPNAIARDRFISRISVPPAIRFFATEGRHRGVLVAKRALCALPSHNYLREICAKIRPPPNQVRI